MKAKKNKKYEELWSKIRDLIRSITKNSDDYDEKYMKIKFNSDDELPPNKMIEILTITIVVRAVFVVVILLIFYYTKTYTKVFQFMTFHAKLQRVQNHCVLGSIK